MNLIEYKNRYDYMTTMWNCSLDYQCNCKICHIKAHKFYHEKFNDDYTRMIQHIYKAVTSCKKKKLKKLMIKNKNFDPCKPAIYYSFSRGVIYYNTIFDRIDTLKRNDKETIKECIMKYNKEIKMNVFIEGKHCKNSSISKLFYNRLFDKNILDIIKGYI